MHGSAILTFPALSHVREALRGRSSREHADVDHANGTKRNYRAKSALTGGLRAFHRPPGASLPAHSALTCRWHVDPDTGRLAASWSLETVEDFTHCCRKSRFTGRAADTAPVARAA
jgi:hypothetical protein